MIQVGERGASCIVTHLF